MKKSPKPIVLVGAMALTSSARVGALGCVLLLFALIASVFVPIGVLLGRLLDACEDKIAAYSANVAGSLIGIWLYLAIAALALLIGYLWIIWDPRKRGWHDYIGGTFVVRRKRD